MGGVEDNFFKDTPLEARVENKLTRGLLDRKTMLSKCLGSIGRGEGVVTSSVVAACGGSVALT